jgi:hypothetical protein
VPELLGRLDSVIGELSETWGTAGIGAGLVPDLAWYLPGVAANGLGEENKCTPVVASFATGPPAGSKILEAAPLPNPMATLGTMLFGSRECMNPSGTFPIPLLVTLMLFLFARELAYKNVVIILPAKPLY